MARMPRNNITLTKEKFKEYLISKGFVEEQVDSSLLMNPIILTKVMDNNIYLDFLFYPETEENTDLFLFGLSENKPLSEIIPQSLNNSDIQIPCSVKDVKIKQDHLEFQGAKVWI